MAGEGVDLLIIGGGITGSGIALDAARRGLRCLLLEKGDIASGTSSRSSKLIHGGLRYLRRMQIRLTRAACRERDRMIDLDPGLVSSIPCLYPAYGRDRTPGWLVEAGLGIYDVLTKGRKHRRLETMEILEAAPHLETSGLRRGLLYFDGRADDARLTLEVAAAAAAAGAGVLSRVEVMERRWKRQEKFQQLLVRDHFSGCRMEISARVIINAAGVWTDELRGRLGLAGRRLRPSRGSHLILDPDALGLKAAVTFSSPVDGRPVFLVPHPEGVLLGTTDLFHEGDLDDPRPTEDEKAYLLSSARALFPSIEVGKHVRGAFAGLRPILDSRVSDPSKASRDEAVWFEDGVLSVAGGKLTTWRLMAEESVDKLRKYLPRTVRSRLRPCSTQGLALPGWAAVVSDRGQTAAKEVEAAMFRRLGFAAGEVLSHAPGEELQPLAEMPDLCRAEIRAHLRHRAVLHLEDLFIRRIRVGMWNPELLPRMLPQVEDIIRKEMNWDLSRWRKEEYRLETALEAWMM